SSILPRRNGPQVSSKRYAIPGKECSITKDLIAADSKLAGSARSRERRAGRPALELVPNLLSGSNRIEALFGRLFARFDAAACFSATAAIPHSRRDGGARPREHRSFASRAEDQMTLDPYRI